MSILEGLESGASGGKGIELEAHGSPKGSENTLGPCRAFCLKQRRWGQGVMEGDEMGRWAEV